MLVLASASPRRRELLAQAGFTFEVHPAYIPEDPSPTNTREKAEAVFAELSSKTSAPLQVVGADTTAAYRWNHQGVES